jgi:sporulation protein YlmC with PRC-barrel domain
MSSDNHVKLLSSGSLTGTKVVNRSGEDLGHLEELMVDLSDGRVAYAVVSFGGILGIGNKLFAVPWEALNVDQEKEQIIMNANKESLENAPGFDKNNWPNSASRNWLDEVYNYYGYPYSS